MRRSHTLPLPFLLLLFPLLAGARNVVYIGSDAGRMLALSAVDGSRLWSYDSGQRITSSPWVAEGVVFCANHAGHVFALSAGK